MLRPHAEQRDRIQVKAPHRDNKEIHTVVRQYLRRFRRLPFRVNPGAGKRPAEGLGKEGATESVRVQQEYLVDSAMWGHLTTAAMGGARHSHCTARADAAEVR